jgi:hypothetical protein
VQQHTAPAIRSIAHLAHHARTGIRVLLASHPDIDGDLLRQLAADPEVAVRAAVAAHPRTPLDVLLHLAGETDDVGRNAVRTFSTQCRYVPAQLGDLHAVSLERLQAGRATVCDALVLGRGRHINRLQALCVLAELGLSVSDTGIILDRLIWGTGKRQQGEPVTDSLAFVQAVQVFLAIRGPASAA